ncbi:conserved exported hypothetical protein [Pseudomonas sp. 9AZ]|uniref:ShlB/FhaC/HecB family hemolysin secretion/activation protein n=1 Tax=Pseudomonas sp. 9AZ TaxID=2653168 RepID=UPI0012EFAA3B|nr:ShlB/FhaC/HecB family hemolysin secretion/activation protein [Pseudomonas sp. 9AZ]VXD02032.1 conserved exported hypothetical protein [Pseudomonas sp. 9AZ]
MMITPRAAWLMLVMLVSISVQAAQPIGPQVPGLVNPNLQREQVEQIQQQQRIEERARRTQVPALRGDAPADQVLPDQGERFVLTGIAFNASVYLPREQLESLAQGYVGREIGFAELNQLLREINALYEARGQLTARALIPAQSLEDGQLRIVLVEAKVDQVTWKGETRKVGERFYAQRLNVQPGSTLDSPALMSAIQRFNATTPGPQVTASLAPGARFGTTSVELEAFEPETLQWSLFANNYGNESTGREQYGGSLTWFSPTAVADALNLLLVTTAGSQYASLRYSRPLNRWNGVAYAEVGGNSMTVEEGPLAALNIEGESRTYTLGFDQPWWLDDNWLLQGGLGYNQQHSENTVESFTLSEVDTREAFLRGQLEYRAAPWYLRYEQRVRQASVDNAVSGDSGSYALLNGQGYLSRALGEQYELVGRFGWQFANNTEELPASLFYQFGGISSVRGYDPGVISSPQGATLNLEAWWRHSPRWQPFVFFDYGRAMELGITDIDLQSVGVGLNFNWGRHLSLSLTAANTLKDVVPDQDGGQVLAQIILR